MITLGLGYVNKLIVNGLNTPKILTIYSGYHRVEETLPPLFKDAYKLVVGRRPTDTHKPSWKSADVVTGKTAIEKYIGVNEIFYGIVNDYFYKKHENYMRQIVQTTFCELLTNVFYCMDKGENETARNLFYECMDTVNEQLKQLHKPDREAYMEGYIDVDNRKYYITLTVYTITP